MRADLQLRTVTEPAGLLLRLSASVGKQKYASGVRVVPSLLNREARTAENYVGCSLRCGHSSIQPPRALRAVHRLYPFRI